MLTKAGKKWLNAPRDNEIIPGVPNGSSSKGCIKTKNCAGTDVVVGPANISGSINLITASSFTATGSSATYGIAVGSGDTPATEDDYTVETYINTLTTSATPTITQSFDSTTGKYNCYVDLTLSNATAADIVVKEVCKFVRGMKCTNIGDTINSTQNNYVSVMVDRTVLETPLTVPAGGAAVLRYNFAYQDDAATT